MLTHLVKKPQKIEPKSVLWLRRLILIIFLIILIGSFAILFNKMLSEQPTVSTTFAPIDSLFAPVIYLGFLYDFTISCSLYYNYNGINASTCDQYITQPKNIGRDDYPFVGKFSSKRDIPLTRYNNNSTGPLFVFLHINLMDSTLNIFNDSAQESSFRMIAYDSEKEYDTMNKDFKDPVSSFEESLFYINKHTLAGRLLYKLGFSRKIRKTLIRTPLAFIGFPATYLTEPYIESDIQNIPMNSSNKDYITVRISPRSFIVAEEYEQRNDTIISILGTIAAFYSSIVFVYVFLFGVDSMRPWGIIHNGCCGFCGFRTRTKLEVSNYVTPSNIGDLEERIIILETFKQVMQNNVVDMSLIEAV